MNALGGKLLDGLKAQPLTVALVIINLLFLGYVVREVAASGARKDALIAELARDCQPDPAKKGDREK